ncbi:MAG: hypothetical protein ACFCU6_09060 [Balneolaceae bacterium]
MAGWIYIALSSACSVLIAHLLNVVETKKLSTLRVLTINYIAAASLAIITASDSMNTLQNSDIPVSVFILTAAVGIIYITNFFIYSKSVFHNGVGVSIASMRISLIIPVLLSTLWYFEVLTISQWLGVLLVFLALFLLLPDKRSFFRKPYNASWLLILLFFFTGFGDASLKIFEGEFRLVLDKEIFMGMIFISAMLAGFIIIAIKNMWNFKLLEIILGIMIGIPNLYSAIFLIEALMLMNGAVVYSVANILTVMGGTILGLIKWGDVLSRLQWAGIFVTMIAIIMLL